MEGFSGFKVLGFDTETTGLDPRKDRIVQYAFVGVDEDGGKIVIDSLVDPCMAIPPSSTSVHGIATKMSSAVNRSRSRPVSSPRSLTGPL